MQAFHLSQPTSLDAALAAANARDAKFIAGGTDLMQLLKDNVESPGTTCRSGTRRPVGIEIDASGLRLGAMARMSDVAAHPEVRAQWPVIAQALEASASPQVRNMGTIGGNLLQRTRCGYFRDTGFACNKREPGSGCPAIAGENRMLAILGGSDHCIATHASDLAVALTALDAVLELRRRRRRARRAPITASTAFPAIRRTSRPCWEPGEMITAVVVPASAACAQFALSEVARPRELRVRPGVRRGRAGNARRHGEVTFGSRRAASAPDHGRLPEVETALRGKPLGRCAIHDASARPATAHARQSRTHSSRSLLRRAVLRTLQTRRPDEGAVPWQDIGQRHRSRRRPAEGRRTCPRTPPSSRFRMSCMRCWCKSTIGAGTYHRIRLSMRRVRCRAFCAIITPDNAPKLPMKGGPQQMVRRCCRIGRVLQRPARRGGRGADAPSGGCRRGAGARAIPARRAGHVDGCRAGAGLSTAQRRAPARFASRQSRCRVRRRGGNGRCHLHHADGTSQSDGAARDDRALGRQPTDRVDTRRRASPMRSKSSPRCSGSTRRMCM